jgi:imidazole glycerol-phosphate synthase subunit HisF
MNRLIARLDTKNNRLIKSISFEGLRVIGDINNFAKKYYNEGIDEILYIDTVASLYDRNSLTEIIKKATEDIFVPITVGGGIRTIEDIKKILRCGADKIAINSEAIRNKKFISEAANIFGSQCIVVSIQAKMTRQNKWEAFYLNGREPSGFDVLDWAKTVEELGAGELLLTSVDFDGTKKGLDKNLIKSVSEAVGIPIIGSGGAKDKEDVLECFQKTSVSALAIGTILHYEKEQIKNIKKII